MDSLLDAIAPVRFVTESFASDSSFFNYAAGIDSPKTAVVKMNSSKPVMVVVEELAKLGEYRLFMEPSSRRLTMVFADLVVGVSGFANSPNEERDRSPQEITFTFVGRQIPDVSFLEEMRSDVKSFAEWNFMSGGNITSARLPLKPLRKLHPQAYPFIEDVDRWIDDYLDSDANVLILNGDPGTGKTTLINHIVQRRSAEITVVYDRKVMECEDLYARILDNEGKRTILILEDADLVLRGRIDAENNAMSTMLNIADGILDTSQIKIILTANMNQSEIDEAMLRPGRCHAYVDFRALNRAEAERLATVIGTDLPDGDEFKLAEIFKSAKVRRRKIGFT